MLEAAAVLIVALAPNTPVGVPTEVAVPETLQRADGAHWELVDLDDPAADPIPASRLGSGPWGQGDASLCFVVPPNDSEGERVVRYALRPIEAPMAPFVFEDVEGGRLRLLQDGHTVLAYNFGMQLPEGVPEDRRRSSYIHPLYGLDGEQVTDDFPEDHYHHRGIFWTWPKVEVNGQVHDLWAIRGILTRFEQWLGREEGAACAVFGVRNGWYVGERRVAKETVWCRVWGAGDVGRAIDFQLTWEAEESPVTLTGATGKGYGGFCLRVPSVEGKTVTRPDGQTVQSSNEERLPWADLSARLAVGDGMSGAAIFIHADNPGFPNGWCLREYGFLGVDWPGLESCTLEPGKPVTANYRVWVHRGDVEGGKAADAYRVYRNPAPVRFGGD